MYWILNPNFLSISDIYSAGGQTIQQSPCETKICATDWGCTGGFNCLVSFRGSCGSSFTCDSSGWEGTFRCTSSFKCEGAGTYTCGTFGKGGSQGGRNSCEGIFTCDSVTCNGDFTGHCEKTSCTQKT